MNKLTFLFLTLLTTLFISCSKNEHVSKAPSLRLIVTNESGEKVVGGVVLLYNNYHDWYETMNPCHSGITNKDGEVLFEDLEEVIYYFDASYAEEYMNYPQGIYRTENPLTEGVLKTVNVTIYKTIYKTAEQ
ncbi:hypothetical protein [Bacteroides sp. 519]|uniref:hypothetical protein n=1 Tax=Bacteroides sp. 519 TaxID=2302937 RepID=UPI0013D2B546|nr:hypothetical protein [Bacteroides sp. 519]NDV56930.1 hypothetical protein [Bacteroides sp. 519]